MQNKRSVFRVTISFLCGFESHRRQYFCRIRMSTSTIKPVFMRIFASCVWDGSGLEPVFSGSMQHEIQHDAANRSGACGDALRLQQSRCIGILLCSDCDYDCAGAIIKCVGKRRTSSTTAMNSRKCTEIPHQQQWLYLQPTVAAKEDLL